MRKCTYTKLVRTLSVFNPIQGGPDRGVGQKLYCAFVKTFWLHFIWEILSTQSNLKDKTKMKYIADLVWPQ